MTSATEFIDEPDTIRNEAVDGGLLVTDNRVREVCDDDRFNLIAKAREKLLDNTNIESKPEEVAVLDSILFRCWQMGWLDQLRDDAATLGSGKLTADQVRECAGIAYLEGYSDGSAHRGEHIDETNWQAIANKLNATPGGERHAYEQRIADMKQLVREMHAEILRESTMVDKAGNERVIPWAKATLDNFEVRMNQLGIGDAK